MGDSRILCDVPVAVSQIHESLDEPLGLVDRDSPGTSEDVVFAKFTSVGTVRFTTAFLVASCPVSGVTSVAGIVGWDQRVSFQSFTVSAFGRTRTGMGLVPTKANEQFRLMLRSVGRGFNILSFYPLL